MKYLSPLKDITLTVLFILIFFTLINILIKDKVPTVNQVDNTVTFTPDHALLRGSLTSTDQSITNWRNNKNIVHWRFKCNQKGLYNISLNHSKHKGSHTIILSSSDKTFKEKISSAKATKLGSIQLTQGIHDLALYALEVPKKTKLPTIHSITLNKIQ
ncbi:MAG: DUF5077 domain-containing protein [Lentisphaeraceae bacterium]|nr:DUF5077 domain-containing protein [Lentisphaeraceae bacterium]